MATVAVTPGLCILERVISYSYPAGHVNLRVFISAGGIDVELAAQVVTALDDVCILSPRSFDAPSLAALLGEVCRWLVEQRIGPRARHDEYKTCDPYAQVCFFVYLSFGGLYDAFIFLCLLTCHTSLFAKADVTVHT